MGINSCLVKIRSLTAKLSIIMTTHFNFLRSTSIAGILYSCSADFRDFGPRSLASCFRIALIACFRLWGDQEHGWTSNFARNEKRGILAGHFLQEVSAIGPNELKRWFGKMTYNFHHAKIYIRKGGARTGSLVECSSTSQPLTLASR